MCWQSLSGLISRDELLVTDASPVIYASSLMHRAGRRQGGGYAPWTDKIAFRALSTPNVQDGGLRANWAPGLHNVDNDHVVHGSIRHVPHWTQATSKESKELPTNLCARVQCGSDHRPPRLSASEKTRMVFGRTALLHTSGLNNSCDRLSKQ